MSIFSHVFCCWWDLPVLILFCGITAFYFVRRHQLSKEKEELQKRLPRKHNCSPAAAIAGRLSVCKDE